MSASLLYPPELLLKAQGVVVVFLDVDGVLTDGGLYLSARGETLKRFHVLDGHGLKMLQAAGMVPVVITGRDSKPLRARLQSLGIGHARFGVVDKCAEAAAVLEELGHGWSDSAVMGDDWPDLGLMARCAFSAAPPNAHHEVRVRVDFVSSRCGGEGAVREFCDLLLMAAGRYDAMLQGALP
jgi:3-deoxy-D-manno-octulosonate 8-phosphate phosphatase (KDO 8-P phosphatase)